MTLVKGQTSNPGGITAARRLVTSATSEAMASRAPRVLERWDKLLDSSDEKIALGAVKLWFDRYLPVPKQATDTSKDGAEEGERAAHYAVLRAKALSRREIQQASDKAIAVDAHVVCTLPKGANN